MNSKSKIVAEKGKEGGGQIETKDGKIREAPQS